MEHTTEFDKSNGICTIRVVGPHRRPEDSLILQQFARDFGEERDCQRFLFDMTQAQIIAGTMATFDTGTVPVDPDHKQIRQKIALVYSSVTDEHKFLEDVAANRGCQLRVFDEINKATKWLTSERDNT